jgi:hypothetical protein
MIRLLYIARFNALAVLLLLLLALAPAKAQLVVFQGETSTLTVVQEPGDTYQWELYNDGTVNFATVPGNCPATSATFVGVDTGTSVNVKWLLPGIYFFKVTAQDITGCTSNIKIGMVEVKPSLPTAELVQPIPDYICVGESIFVQVKLTGVSPWEFTYTDGTDSWTVKGVTDSDYPLKLSPASSSQFWITEVKNANGSNPIPSAKVVIVVNPKPDISKIYQH